MLGGGPDGPANARGSTTARHVSSRQSDVTDPLRSVIRAARIAPKTLLRSCSRERSDGCSRERSDGNCRNKISSCPCSYFQSDSYSLSSEHLAAASARDQYFSENGPQRDWQGAWSERCTFVLDHQRSACSSCYDLRGLSDRRE